MVWTQCISAVEVAWISKEEFGRLWKSQYKNPALMINYNIL
jgi:hypothetical protein